MTGGLTSNFASGIATDMAGIYGPDVLPVGTYNTISYYVYVPNSKFLGYFGKKEVYIIPEFGLNGKLQWHETEFTTSY